MRCHHTGGKQLQHGQSTKPPLQHHQKHQNGIARQQPFRQLITPPPGGSQLDEQRHTDHESVEPVKPLQEDLEIHLPSWQERAVAERPVGAGQPGLHYTRRATDHHKSHKGDHQMAGELSEPTTNRPSRRTSQWKNSSLGSNGNKRKVAVSSTTARCVAVHNIN